MPNYTGFESERPFSSFIAGMGAADQMRHTALKSETMRASLDQQRDQRSALQTYKETGDARGLIPYMTPEQAMTAPFTDELQKLKIGAAAVDWWDKVKGNATLETYPAIMADAAQRFPSIAQMHFPPAESFRSPADFEKWKYEREAMAARFKQMASPYLGRPVTLRPGGVAIDPVTGRKLYEQPTEPKIYKPEAFTGPNGEVKWIQPGVSVPPGFSKRGPEETKLPKSYKPELFFGPNGESRWIKPGDSVPNGFVKRRQTPLQDEKTEQERAKTRILQRLGGAKSTSPAQTAVSGYKGPAYYYDKAGNEVAVRSQEEYDKLVGK